MDNKNLYNLPISNNAIKVNQDRIPFHCSNGINKNNVFMVNNFLCPTDAIKITNIGEL